MLPTALLVDVGQALSPCKETLATAHHSNLAWLGPVCVLSARACLVSEKPSQRQSEEKETRKTQAMDM